MVSYPQKSFSHLEDVRMAGEASHCLDFPVFIGCMDAEKKQDLYFIKKNFVCFLYEKKVSQKKRFAHVHTSLSCY